MNFINDQLVDDQSLIYSLFNNINDKLIKPLEIEMIGTVDRSFLEGILQEYYVSEESTNYESEESTNKNIGVLSRLNKKRITKMNS